MLSRISNFSGPLSNLFKKKSDQTNLILDLQSIIGLSGVTWNDQSAYNNDATLYGTIATASLSNGTTVLSLDGVNDYIYPTNGFGNILDTGFTYEVWACPGTSSNGVLLLETGQAATSSLWNDNQMAFVSNKINVGLFDPSNFTPNYITGPTFSPNTWYNIVMTYDGNTLIEYVNGVSIGSSTGIKSNPSSVGGTTYLSLGRPGLATNYLGGSTGYFKGYIGVWRIWDGPLTSVQILSNYNGLKSTYNPLQPTQLLLNPSFDSGTTDWTSNVGFAAYSYTSANRPAVLSSILYFTYVNTTVSQSVSVSGIISSANTFTAVVNIKHREKGDAATYTQIDKYSFEVLFKNAAGATIFTKRTPTSGQQNAPQYFTDVTLTLNRSEIPATFNNISSIQVNISGIDTGYWNGNHGPMVDYVTLTVI
jgi:hypothetical protein